MEPEYSLKSIEDRCEAQSHYKTYSRQRSGDSFQFKLSASTRCICVIPELRLKIFELVRDTHSTLGARRPGNETLLALALTCKTFTEPALAILWRDLSGIGPLIKCLPRSLWRLVGPELQFRRAMTLDDWSIFCKYNHHVRSLNASIYPQFCTQTWRALSCPPFFLPLLPNLMSLTWDWAPESFQYIRLFVSPKITKLDLVTCGFGPSEYSILSCISMLCPFVSHFHDRSFVNTEDSSTVLQSWSRLTSVSTSTVSEASILHLSKLPLLRFLRLDLPLIPMSMDMQKLEHPAFCALQELVMDCASLVLLDAFFERFSISPKSISLHVYGGIHSARALSASISRLSDRCAHSSLERLKLAITNPPTDRITSVRTAALRPLFAFSNLRKLDLTVHHRYISRWDDAVLLQMAETWPLLEVLHLSNDRSRGGITPNAFISLLQHCPRLVSVGVIVDWSTIDGCHVSPDAPYRGFAHKALSEAFFGSSRIRHPARIAAFISAIAPSLESIVTWPNMEQHGFEKYSARWECVHDLIKTFSAVREQGRRMVTNTGEGADEKRGSYHHHGITQSAHETENGDTTIGGDVSQDSGSESESEYTSDESSEE